MSPRKVTTEEYIQRARVVHGRKYKYDNVLYLNMHKKIRITCLKHGDFLQTPANHIKGNNCPKCSTKYRDKSLFISNVRKIHGDKYTYGKVEYNNNIRKVIITCADHGDFTLSPTSHLQGQGCPKCSRNYKDTALFILEAQKAHNDKYNYNNATYTNSRTKVNITCLKHGDFPQKPSQHLSGQGCPKCTKNVWDTSSFIAEACKLHGDKYKYTHTCYVNGKKELVITCPKHGDFNILPGRHTHNKQGCPKCSRHYKDSYMFITQAQEVHGEKYLYHNIEYKQTHEKVTISCPEHGDFKQTPNRHLQGQGCPKCSRPCRDTASFVQEAEKVHKNKYDYSKCVYNGSKIKVVLICQKHGEFNQIPNNHLQGAGCPECGGSRGEKKIRVFLENILMSSTEQKRFPQCRSIYPLPFDFYLPELDLLIEYQGVQHYRSIDFFGGVEEFKDRQKKDRIKKEYATKNHNFLAVPYWEFDNIEKLVGDKIKELTMGK